MGQLIPTVEEQKRVFPFEKEWFTIENRTMRFFIIMTTIPMVHVRIETWLFMKELFSKVKNIWERLDIMSMAFKEIRESKKLPIILGVLLKIGNHLNTGKSRSRSSERAQGFQLSTIFKLKYLKSADKKVSLLQYIVGKVMQKPGDMHLKDELLHVERATRLQWSSFKGEVSVLRRRMQKVKNLLKNCQKYIYKGIEASDGNIYKKLLRPKLPCQFQQKVKEFYDKGKVKIQSLEKHFAEVENRLFSIAKYLSIKDETEVLSGVLEFSKCWDDAIDAEERRCALAKKMELRK